MGSEAFEHEDVGAESRTPILVILNCPSTGPGTASSPNRLTTAMSYVPRGIPIPVRKSDARRLSYLRDVSEPPLSRLRTSLTLRRPPDVWIMPIR